MNSKFTRAIACILTLTVVSGASAAAAYALAEKNSDVKNDVREKISERLDSKDESSFSAEKDETVYVICASDGSVEKVIVSDWIKNTAGADEISDAGELDNVKNVRGDESYVLDTDGMRVWSADGGDIYCQGTTEKTIPVDLSVSYYLDGEKMSAEDIAGKSGRVTVRMDYTNNYYEKTQVVGEEQNIYVPFLMLSGLIMDNDSFSNVEITNGKVINDGSRTVAVGFALPGMQENLGVSADEFEIPSYVEISADTDSFSLSTIMTLATNEMFNEIDLDGTEDIQSLEDKLGQLTDAMTALMDGSSQLYNGLATLLDKSGELINGVNTLNEGAAALADGTAQLSSGAAELSQGAASLNGYLDQLSSGAAALSSGAAQVSQGADQLDIGIAQLRAGVGKITANNEKLTAGAETVFNTLLASVQTQVEAAGIQIETLTIENYGDILDGAIASISDDNVKALALKKAQATVRPIVESTVRANVLTGVLSSKGLTKEIYDALPEDSENKAAIDAAVNQLMESEEIKKTIEAEVEKAMNGEQVKQQIDEALATAKAGRDSLAAAKAQLDSYNEFYEGILDYTNGTSQVEAVLEQLGDGADKLSAGASQVNSGAGTLAGSAAQIAEGSSALKVGSASLAEGAAKADDGAKALKDGTGKLAATAPALKDGVSQLKAGAMQLSEGLNQLNSQGVQPLVDAAGGISNLAKRLSAVSRVSRDYRSFTGVGEDMSGSVRFIYKTTSVG